MTDKLINDLLDSISEVVSSEGPWQEKRDAILKNCSDDLKTSLLEFIAWFES